MDSRAAESAVTSKASLEQFIELIQCPVEMDIFRDPITFSCGHSFSSGENVASLTNCPLCRNQNEGFVSNRTLTKIVEQLSKIDIDKFPDAAAFLAALKSVFCDDLGVLLSENSKLLGCGHSATSDHCDGYDECNNPEAKVFASKDYVVNKLIETYKKSCAVAGVSLSVELKKITPLLLRKIYVSGNKQEFYRHIEELINEPTSGIQFSFDIITKLKEPVVTSQDVNTLDLLMRFATEKLGHILPRSLIFSYLSFAIYSNRTEIVKHICKTKSFLRVLGLDQPMIAYCLQENKQDKDNSMLRCLLAAGFDPTATIERGDLPIRTIIRESREDCLKEFVAAARRNPALRFVPEGREQSPFVIEALNFLSDNGFRLLLSLPGIDVNVPDETGDFPLMLALKNNMKNKVMAIVKQPSLSEQSLEFLDSAALKKIKADPDLVLYKAILSWFINTNINKAISFIRVLLTAREVDNREVIKQLSAMLRYVYDVCPRDAYHGFIKQASPFLVARLMRSKAEPAANTLLRQLQAEDSLPKALFITEAFRARNQYWTAMYLDGDDFVQLIDIVENDPTLAPTVENYLLSRPGLWNRRLANGYLAYDYLAKSNVLYLKQALTTAIYHYQDDIDDVIRESIVSRLTESPDFFFYMLQQINNIYLNELFLFLYESRSHAVPLLTVDIILQLIENRDITNQTLKFILSQWIRKATESNTIKHKGLLNVLTSLLTTKPPRIAILVRFFENHTAHTKVRAILPEVIEGVKQRSQVINSLSANRDEFLRKLITFLSAWHRISDDIAKNGLICIDFIYSILGSEYNLDSAWSQILSFDDGNRDQMAASMFLSALADGKPDDFILSLARRPEIASKHDGILIDGKSLWHWLVIHQRWNVLEFLADQMSPMAKRLAIQSGQYAGCNLTALTVMTNSLALQEHRWLLPTIYSLEPNNHGQTPLMLTLSASRNDSFRVLWQFGQVHAEDLYLNTRVNSKDEFYDKGDTVLLVAIKANSSVDNIKAIASVSGSAIDVCNDEQHTVFSLLIDHAVMSPDDKIELLIFFLHLFEKNGLAVRRDDLMKLIMLALECQHALLFTRGVNLLKDFMKWSNFLNHHQDSFKLFIKLFPTLMNKINLEKNLELLSYYFTDIGSEKSQQLINAYIQSGNLEHHSDAQAEQRRTRDLALIIDSSRSFVRKACCVASLTPIISAVSSYFTDPHNIAYYQFRHLLAEYARCKQIPADFRLDTIACLPPEHASLIFQAIPAQATLSGNSALFALYSVLKDFIAPTTAPQSALKISIEDLSEHLAILNKLYQVESRLNHPNKKAALGKIHQQADSLLDTWSSQASAFSAATAAETRALLLELKALDVVKISHALKGIFFYSNCLRKIDKYMTRLDQVLLAQQSTSSVNANPN